MKNIENTKEIEKNIRIIASIIIGFIICLFVKESFQTSGNSILFIFLFFANCYLINNKIKKIEKRKAIISAIIAFLFAITEVVCTSINTTHSFNNIINDKFALNLKGKQFFQKIS